MKNVCALFGAALALRLTAWIALGAIWRPEMIEEHDVAWNLVKTGDYFYDYLGTRQHSFGYPMYPFLMAGFFKLFGLHTVLIGLFHLVVSAMLAPLTYLLGRLVCREREAVLGASLVALHPGLIVYACKWHQMPMVSAVYLLFFIGLFRGGCDRILPGAGLGLLAAFGTLLRSTTMALTPCAWIYQWLMRKKTAGAVFCMVAFVAGIAPWAIRNQTHYGTFVFLGTTTGEAFWRGNHEQATGTALSLDNQALFHAAPENFRRQVESKSDIGQYRFFSQTAKNWIAENPGKFAELTTLKFLYFWTFAPTTGFQYPAMWKAGYLLLFFPMILLALFGLWLVHRTTDRTAKIRWGVMFLFGLGLAAQHALCYVELRHRWAFEPILLLAAAIGLNRIWIFIRDRRSDETR